MPPALSRFDQLLFADLAGTDQIAKFGSLAAGAPQRYDGASVTPALIQALSRYRSGWVDAVIDGSSPAIEDMNALCYLFAYQLAYLMERGVPQWSAGTTYWIGSIAQIAGVLYISRTDNNLNNSPLTSVANWYVQGSNVRNVMGTDTATALDDYLRDDPTAGSFVQTLPPIATVPIGKELTVKNMAVNGNTVSVTGDALIDNQATIVLNGTAYSNDSITVKKGSATNWDIV